MAFDVITPVKLGRGALATSPSLTTVYTTPALTRAIVKCIEVCNTTSGALTLNIYLVESGGTAGASNQLISALSIAANSTFQWTGTQVLNTGDLIQANGSGSGLTINASGAEAV